MYSPFPTGFSPFWLMQIFSVAESLKATPVWFDFLDFIGQSEVPSIEFYGASSFAAFVRKTPEKNFGWRIFGVLRVLIPGPYIFCAMSNISYLFYIRNLATSHAGTRDATSNISGYSLFFSDSGIETCKSIQLESGNYSLMVRICAVQADFTRIFELKLQISTWL